MLATFLLLYKDPSEGVEYTHTDMKILGTTLTFLLKVKGWGKIIV